MSRLMTALTFLSLAVLALLSIYNYVKEKNGRRFTLHMLALVFIIVFLHQLFAFPFSSLTPTGRGTPENEVYLVIALYFFMVLGMVAHYAYTRFEQPKQLRKKFDLGLFVAPIFASPIIFIPLLGALQNTELDLTRLTAPKMMMFFVAFENGFFWKEYFDHRRQEKAAK